jgi:soluble lytic murein transglycosylase
MLRVRFRLLALLLALVLVPAVLAKKPSKKAARGASAPVAASSSSTSASSPSAADLRAYREGWAEALALYRKGRFDQASRRLEALEGGDSLASLYRSAVLAGSLLAARDTARADAVLAAVLGRSRDPQAVRLDPVWSRHFHRLRLRTCAALPPPARRDYLVAALAAPLEDAVRVEILHRLLALDTAVVPRAARMGYLRQLISLALPGSRLDGEYRRWLLLYPPADTAWEAQRLALDLEEKLGLWNEAIARGTALQSLASSPETLKVLQNKIALWHYNKGSYTESIREYALLRTRHGDTPEMLLQVARAYRALSLDAPSQVWYSRLVEQFPKDPRSAETLWMRAFDDEMLGRADTALAAYARIARDFPQHARAGEAMFRAGLVLYRRGDFVGAARAFADLKAARKSGRLTGAARYWEGRALAASSAASSAATGAVPDSAARAAWISLAREHPFGHYGHMARRELARRGALPDSLEWKRRLNPAWGDEAVQAWFATVSPSASSSTASPANGTGESAWLPVNGLFDLGLDTLAVLTLQVRAAAAPGNLWLLYDAAVRCRAAGFDYEAYRFALRLSDRLPVEQWPAAPVAVLRLFYPPSYAPLVRPAAGRAGLPPALVLALIKQESGFDPNAVSRVGARGLMQLMPVTGTEQARKEGLAGFHPDSLFTPAVNVRLGVAYLRDVLRRHDGNIEFALAHYNAGPSALARWMPRLEGRPPEDAVEDIGYAETRDYVKRVSANYRTYQVLWEEMK